MPKYRATTRAFVEPQRGHSLLALNGDEFEAASDVTPGFTWEPLDDEARRLKALSIPDPHRSPIGHKQLFALAKSLGASGDLHVDDAKNFVAAWRAAELQTDEVT